MTASNEQSQKKRKVFYVQPILAGYRAPIIEALAEKFEVTAFHDNTDAQKQGHKPTTSESFSTIPAPSTPFLGNRIFYQKNIIKNLIKTKPEAVITFANPRYLSFWLLMITSYMLKIKFFSHGQGLYSYTKPSQLRKLMYRAICKYSTKYVCYTELSKSSMFDAGVPSEKLITIQNSLQLKTHVEPDQKTYKEPGVLFIGRLRDGCRLDELIQAVHTCRINGMPMELHVIGSGELETSFKTHHVGFEWIHWYGAIHDEIRIAEISKQCRIGCYPGDAGLSVVHLFSLGLPPLVHRKIEDHMGPEPSYIIDNKNGFLFDKNGPTEELSSTLNTIWQLSTLELNTIATASYATYLSLNAPPMGDQFVQLVLDNTN